MEKQKYDLDTTLIEFGDGDNAVHWTARNAVEGVQIFGGIGSGKTSGSGSKLAIKYLSAGFGGLVLTAKPEEKVLWEKYCRLAGRSADDLIVVDREHENYFNFLDYEGGGDSITDNIVQVLKTVIRAGEGDKEGGSDDRFWEDALDLLIFNVIDLCKLAYGTVSVQKMYDIVQALPKRDQQYGDKEPDAFIKAFRLAQINVNARIDEWERSLDRQELERLQQQPDYEEIFCDAVSEARTFRFVVQFCTERFKNLAERTRNTIEFSFSSFLFRLLRDPVYSLFCHHQSTFTPDASLDGKIILINLPVKTYHKVGRDCQIMFKYIWQRAMERKEEDEFRIPIFLWADEAQHFIHEHDAESQATARSSRIATVYLSQNLPNYYANMGGAKYNYRVASFLGTLNTKFFHANTDIETNKYASDFIGDGFYEDIALSHAISGEMAGNINRSPRIDKAIRPEVFNGLKTGSKKNNRKVEAIMHVQGMQFKDEKNILRNYLRVQFTQETKQ